MNDFKIIPTLILALFAHVCTAQFQAGAKVDLVSNNVQASSGAVDLNNLLQSKAGYKIGATVAYDFTDRFSLESGLTYNALGFQVSQNTDVNILGMSIPLGATLETTVDYLEIPLLANYKIDLGSISAYVQAGPSINYATSGRIRTIANSILDFNVLDQSIDLKSSSVNRTNLSGNLGLGISQVLSPDMVLSAGITYAKDLTSSVNIPIVDTQIKNQNIGLGLKLSRRF